MKIVHTFGFK